MTTTTLNWQLANPTRTTQAAIANAWNIFQVLRSRARQRNHLARLSVEHLDDIGITEVQALAETRKPFWRA